MTNVWTGNWLCPPCDTRQFPFWVPLTPSQTAGGTCSGPAGSLLDHSQTPGYLDSLKHRMVYSTYSSTSFDNILTVYFPCWPQFNFSSIPSSGLHVGSFFWCHCEVPDSEKIEPFDIPIFLPHELLHSIVHAGYCIGSATMCACPALHSSNSCQNSPN